MSKRWTKKQLEKHIKMNTTDKAGVYSAVVVIAALYKKLYGELPKIGLSGAQAEFANSVIASLPKRQINNPDEC
jgi:hypothetical protein